MVSWRARCNNYKVREGSLRELPPRQCEASSSGITRLPLCGAGGELLPNPAEWLRSKLARTIVQT